MITATCASTSWGWSLHYLVTERALKHPSMKDLDQLVQTEELEHFLKAEREEISKLFQGYYQWLSTTGSKRFRAQTFQSSTPTTAEFLKAARLNPETKFPYVVRVAPYDSKVGQIKKSEMINPSSFIPGAELSYKVNRVFIDTTNQSLSARSILQTFADEPDWFMDMSLWGREDYGYGAIPYGRTGDGTEKAAFHILYQHEPIIVRFAAPEILEGMTLHRIELFFRLARLAFKTNHPYWGYRFTAWASHYVQDICQPYHAKSVPHANLWFFVKYLFSANKEQIKKDTTQLVKNRHFLYEDFIGAVMEQRNEFALFADKALSQALIEPGLKMINDDMKTWLDIASKVSAKRARDLDQAIVEAFPSRMVNDPSYDTDLDPEYHIDKVMAAMSQKSTLRIFEESKAHLSLAGILTRELVTRARAEVGGQQ